ncbi:MAG: ABC transporter permease [Gemmatimonadaceae bacterium]|nr:ABC transporter permease [Gemmatimonadaceae bacterium]NUQ93309.1 ABC transporter permease [Gemmatimonadaceae bacterium]NUR18042.1 ABC transporter permease [Gemmatimonadaceae bacterium]NUS97461.1 ABC transporter permease [Gemmatimonadaceae bacterium]
MRLLLRHLAAAALLLWIVVTVVFVLARLAPGDPVLLVVSPGASAEEIATTRARLGLDAPIAVQYARWAGGALRGDLGTSVVSGRPVRAVLAEALPVSLALGVASLLLSFAIGLAVGAIQAKRAGTRGDLALTVASTSLAAAPAFWLALGAIAVFTYGASRLGFPEWMRLPAFGLHAPAGSGSGLAALIDVARHAVLPVAVLTAIGAAGIARYARSTLLDVVDLEAIRAARGRGIGGAMLAGHVLRIALPALVVLFALALPGVIAGSVFVESVFAWPGMGRAMTVAILSRDVPVVLGATLLYAAGVIGANLTADLLLPVVDPRLR